VTQHGKHTINKPRNFNTLLIPLFLNFNASGLSVYPPAFHEDFYIVFTHTRKHRHLEQNELST